MKYVKNRLSVQATIVIACLSGIPVAFTPTSADAYRATEPTLRAVRNEVASVRSAVDKTREEVNATGTRIIEALRLSRAEGSSYVDKQIESTRRMMDASEMNNVQMQRDLIRAEAESAANQPNPALCLLGSLFGGGDAPSGGAVNDARDQMAGADPTVFGPALGQANSVIEAMERLADHRGSADPTSDTSLLTSNPTYPSDEEAREVATRITRNMIDPLPPRPISAEEMKTPEGFSRAAARQATRTRESAILDAIAFTLNLREPVTPYNDQFKAYVEDSHYNRIDPDAEPTEISELQGIDIRTVRQYAPKQEALDARATLNEKGLLQEILDAISINNRIAYLQLEQDNRHMLVSSAILARMLDN